MTDYLRSMRDLLPSRDDLDLRPATFRADLLAGITVGVVALPLALAFGVSSGVGPAAGLVTAVVAGIVAAVFGGSRVQVSGPTGAMAVVLAPLVAAHGAASVPIVAVLAGAIVLVAGGARLGRAVAFIPWPVVEGFTLGIAAIIFLQQVPAAVDVDAPVGGNPLVTAVRAVSDAGSAVAWSLGGVAVVAAIMLLLPRVAPGLPASLVAVVVVTVAAELLDAPLARIGALPDGLPAPSAPTCRWGCCATSPDRPSPSRRSPRSSRCSRRASPRRCRATCPTTHVATTRTASWSARASRRSPRACSAACPRPARSPAPP